MVFRKATFNAVSNVCCECGWCCDNDSRMVPWEEQSLRQEWLIGRVDDSEERFSQPEGTLEGKPEFRGKK